MAATTPLLCRTCFLRPPRRSPQRLSAAVHLVSPIRLLYFNFLSPKNLRPPSRKELEKLENGGNNDDGDYYYDDNGTSIGTTSTGTTSTTSRRAPRPKAKTQRAKAKHPSPKPPKKASPPNQKANAPASGNPRTIDPGLITAPQLPLSIRHIYPRNCVVSFARLLPRDADDPSASIGTLPPPPVRDLIAAHELFGRMCLDQRWTRIQFVRSSLAVPDICLLGRAAIGKTALVAQIMAAHGPISKSKLLKDPVATSMPPTNTRPEVFGWGFRTSSAKTRIRIVDPEGYGHSSAATTLPELGVMIQKRKMIRGAGLVVSAVSGGLHEVDIQCLQMLVRRDVPFVVIVNKAHAFVPRGNGVDEPGFQPALWRQLLATVDEVLQVIDETGASHLHRGTFAVGPRTFHGAPMGVLGVKYAFARLSGLVGDATWQRVVTAGATACPPLDKSEIQLASVPELGPLYEEPLSDGEHAENAAVDRQCVVNNLELHEQQIIETITNYQRSKTMERIQRIKNRRQNMIKEKRPSSRQGGSPPWEGPGVRTKIGEERQSPGKSSKTEAMLPASAVKRMILNLDGHCNGN